jgi:hypothetical protein
MDASEKFLKKDDTLLVVVLHIVSIKAARPSSKNRLQSAGPGLGSQTGFVHGTTNDVTK